MRVECFVNFMLRYCWDKTSVAGGMLTGSSQSSLHQWFLGRKVVTGPQCDASPSWRRQNQESLGPASWSSPCVLEEEIRFFWWFNLSLNCAQRSAGSFTSKYCIRSVWSKCRRKSTTACYLHTTCMFYAGLGPKEVDAIGLTNVLAKSSALRIVFASLIHSRKLEPSEFSCGNSNAWNLDSMTTGGVTWDCLLYLFIFEKNWQYLDKVWTIFRQQKWYTEIL